MTGRVYGSAARREIEAPAPAIEPNHGLSAESHNFSIVVSLEIVFPLGKSSVSLNTILYAFSRLATDSSSGRAF